MSQLASNASVTPSHLSRVVARLEKRQWTTRSSDRDDARRTLAHLTEAGARIVSCVEPGYVEEIRRCIFDVLSPAQAQQLEGLTKAVLTSLRPAFIQASSLLHGSNERVQLSSLAKGSFTKTGRATRNDFRSSRL